MVDIQKRKSLKKIGVISAAFATGIGLSDLLGCVGVEVKPGEENIQNFLQDYDKRTKDWDRVFGPSLLMSLEFGGLANFKGHLGHRYQYETPGVDYEIHTGTPLVSPLESTFHKTEYHRYAGLLGWYHSSNKSCKISFVHLSRSLIPEKYKVNNQDAVQISFPRNVIIALSGSPADAPRDSLNIPQLHLGMHTGSQENYGFVDPEQYGPDKGKPIYWDLETDLDMVSTARLMGLEKTIKGIPQELESWPQGEHDLDELKGNISEYYGRIGNATRMEILDSAAFHDMRALLKGEILEKSKTTKHVPGTRPYSLMLKTLGYSSIDQNFVLTLPFPSPDLAGLQLEGRLAKNLKPYRLVS